jgi:hypothetical protein
MRGKANLQGSRETAGGNPPVLSRYGLRNAGVVRCDS